MHEHSFPTRRSSDLAGGGEKTAKEFGVPFLGKLPFDPGFVRGGDDGVHRIVSEPEGPSAIAFAEIVAHIQNIVESAPTTGKLEII
jgi:ATP-binding protein involved in chromosome partitioning